MQRAAAVVLLSLVFGSGLPGATTERLHLSGTGPHDAVEWEFSIDEGRRVGEETTIPVPSQWELEGFGEFAYGQDDEVRAEVGSYRTSFSVPDEWRGRRIDLVFEGVMTDTEAVLNGGSVGDRHRGGFTRFSYDVSSLIRFDSENVLQVEVWEASNDRTVNAAERQADYWVFGGIYRPVYLEARPTPGIRHLAIDARHGGSVRAEVEVDEGDRQIEILGEVVDENGMLVGRLTAEREDQTRGRWILTGTFGEVQSWSAETPVLYTLSVELKRKGKIEHSVRERFGFRTVEVKPGEGLFVNGRRTLFKGINRHSFWPETGRALTPEQNRRDVQLIKSLNANAVRTSHYPPDEAFLDACDELGLYVVNELPGWHDAYRASVGRPLVAEMVRRDVNHPSVVVWANGNEGGWNPLLDRDFARHDPQARPVIHPQAVFGGFDTFHYPSWEELRSIVESEGAMNWLRGRFGSLPLVMPTEMLHGLYDGGAGAGLADFWKLIRESPRGAGAFLWALVDEGVVRDDREGQLDTFGNYAPDGIVGPYREKEASFATVREIWSPVQLAGSEILPETVVVTVENQFDSIDLERSLLAWRWVRWPGPSDAGGLEVLDRGLAPGPSAGPGESGRLTIPRPDGADALVIEIEDPSGMLIESWTVPVTPKAILVERWLGAGEVVRVGKSAALKDLGLPPVDGVEGEWRRSETGWIRLEASLPGPVVLLDLVPDLSQVAWLGRGPTPVWRNRLAGPDMGVWSSPGHEGYFDDVLWARIEDAEGALLMVLESPGLFVGFSAPEFPADARQAAAVVPPVGSLSFHRSVPPMGSKFHPGEALEAPVTVRDREDQEPVVIWFRRMEAPEPP